jgi:hypothetical protein
MLNLVWGFQVGKKDKISLNQTKNPQIEYKLI